MDSIEKMLLHPLSRSSVASEYSIQRCMSIGIRIGSYILYMLKARAP